MAHNLTMSIDNKSVAKLHYQTNSICKPLLHFIILNFTNRLKLYSIKQMQLLLYENHKHVLWSKCIHIHNQIDEQLKLSSTRSNYLSALYII